MSDASLPIDRPVARHTRSRVAFVAMLALTVLALAILAIAFPPDGHSRGGDAWRFAGRLHPMLVHLPIGLLLLVPVLEVVGTPLRLRHLRASAGFVLGLGATAAIASASLGYTLARFDGMAGSTLTWHLWTGLATASLSVVALALRSVSSFAYVISLTTLVVTLGLAGHFGGQLSHGENYLSDVAPRAIARFLGPVRAAPATKPTFEVTLAPTPLVLTSQPTTTPATTMPAGPVTFAGDVMPMFVENCVACHGPAKVKGGLWLDRYARAMQGGESGPAILAGDAAASDLYDRMTLPIDDDDAMPPKNAPHRPTAAQVDAVKRWINAGAKE